MSKMKRIMSVLACTILVLAMALSASAEAGVARISATTSCVACGATASFSRYGKAMGYRTSKIAGRHDEYSEAFYFCAKGHATVMYDWVEGQHHFVGSYTDLGHTGSASDTHQYWVTCPCGRQENVYINGCDYKNTGVHKTP